MACSNRNYQKELDKLIESLGNKRPVLMLHGCCAPCSSYCLEYLSQYFDIKLLFYNPNISIKEEYEKRLAEIHRLVKTMDLKGPVEIIDGRYEPLEFFAAIKGYEDCKEGGDRCKICYELRLREAAFMAQKLKADYFTSTLSISPLKRSELINQIGERLSEEYKVSHLPSDFKKKNGYKRSIELSAEFDLYRQNYCGCIYSKR